MPAGPLLPFMLDAAERESQGRKNHAHRSCRCRRGRRCRGNCRIGPGGAVVQRRGAERAARGGCQRDRGQADGGNGNVSCLLRRTRHGRHQGRGRGRGTGALRPAAARDLAATLPVPGRRRQRRHPGAFGQRHGPQFGAGQGLRDDPDRYRPCRRRHHRQVDAPARRQAGHREDHRFLPSRGARRHRRRKGLRRGLLRRQGGARLFRRLLDGRTHGDDGGPALPRRL